MPSPHDMDKLILSVLVTVIIAVAIKHLFFSSMEHPTAFDPLRCATLHNQIVEFIKPSATAEPYNNIITRNFFAALGPPSQALRQRLTREMMLFLENIDIPVAPEGSQQIGFAPFLGFPTHWMFEQLVWLPWDGLEDGRVITLYGYSEQGLFFNLDTGLCTWNTELMIWPQKWYPLERALTFYLSQYENGKYGLAHGEDIIGYATHDLERSLEAYHVLLSTIQSRISGSTIGEPGLVDIKTLENFQITRFRRDFLTQAKKPSFEFIAPGIRIPTTAWLDELLTADLGSERYHQVREENHRLVVPDDDEEADAETYDGDPFPLFPGPIITSTPPAFAGPDRAGEMIVGRTSGLYLWPEWPISIDHVKLILPFPLGQNGVIERGNPDLSPEALYEKPVHEDRIGNDVLYQHGHCPFNLPHPAKLFTVLRNWQRMVESGRWQVDDHGVMGGIEVFREADTEEGKEGYILGACEDRERE